MFPQGGPGVALLLLRISVAAAFVISIANRFSMPHAPLIFAGVLLVAISLTIGFLTPLLSGVVCLAFVANLLINPSASYLLCIFCALDAIALALLGPGAYSLDARLFGRRVTVMTPAKHTNRT